MVRVWILTDREREREWAREGAGDRVGGKALFFPRLRKRIRRTLAKPAGASPVEGGKKSAAEVDNKQHQKQAE